MAFPSSLDSFPTILSSTKQDDSGFELDILLNQAFDAIEALEAGLGTGASNATPAAGKVRRATGTGTAEWGAVATGDIAANAVTQSGSATNGGADSTTSTSFVDMASMSVTLTTAGGPVLVWAVGAATHSLAGTNFQVGFQVDAAATVAGPSQHSAATVGEAKDWSNIEIFTGLSAASHTFKTRWLTSGGTITAYGVRKMIVVELKR